MWNRRTNAEQLFAANTQLLFGANTNPWANLNPIRAHLGTGAPPRAGTANSPDFFTTNPAYPLRGPAQSGHWAN